MVNVGIHCGYNVFVPEPLLNCLHVGTCLNQLCGMGMAQAVIIKIDSKLLPDDSLAIGKAVFGCQLSVFINADKIDSPRACGKDFLCADNSLSRRSFFVRKIDKLIYCVEFAIFQFVFKLSVFLGKGIPRILFSAWSCTLVL